MFVSYAKYEEAGSLVLEGQISTSSMVYVWQTFADFRVFHVAHLCRQVEMMLVDTAIRHKFAIHEPLAFCARQYRQDWVAAVVSRSSLGQAELFLQNTKSLSYLNYEG